MEDDGSQVNNSHLLMNKHNDTINKTSILEKLKNSTLGHPAARIASRSSDSSASSTM